MDDWPLVEKLIKELDENLDVPVTAKIRVYDDLEKSVEYAKMVEKAGAQIIAVHGRTREQKRLAEYKCNW
jgi:tRNA-dihydrouridine synthase 1